MGGRSQAAYVCLCLDTYLAKKVACLYVALFECGNDNLGSSMTIGAFFGSAPQNYFSGHFLLYFFLAIYLS